MSVFSVYKIQFCKGWLSFFLYLNLFWHILQYSIFDWFAYIFWCVTNFVKTLYKLLSVANCNKVVVSSATSYLQDACCCSLKCNFQLLKNSQLSEETFYMLCICFGLIRIYRLSSSSSALSGNKYRRKNELWLLIRPVCFVGKFLMWWGDCSLTSYCVL